MIDRTTGFRVGYAGTSTPSRAVEYSSQGAGGVREYKLSPEELEEVRRKYPATKRDKTFKKPVAHNPSADRLPAKQRNHKPEEDNEMSGRPEKQGPNNGLTKQVFLEQIAAGETVASIEKAWGMKYNTLSFWVKKWDVRGIDAAKAQELLAGGTPKETQLLREKEALPPAERQAEEVKRLKAEIEYWKAQATEAVALAGKAAEESTAKNERLEEIGREAAEARDAATHELNRTIQECEILQERLERVTEERSREVYRLMTERDGLQKELNRLITERDELQAERDAMLSHIEATGINPQQPEPATDVHLLDRSIADLTRAKWILDRLSASGE